MNVIMLDVLEVVSIYGKKSNTTANGISREIQVAQVKVEGGEFRIPVADGVVVPPGWNGKALCTARSFSYAKTFQGNANARFGFEPVEITSFKPEKQLPKITLQDVLSSFSSSASAVDSQGKK